MSLLLSAPLFSRMTKVNFLKSFFPISFSLKYLGKPYPLDSQQISDLFMIFNTSGDGSMSMQEFVYCWNGWITKVGSGWDCKVRAGSSGHVCRS